NPCIYMNPTKSLLLRTSASMQVVPTKIPTAFFNRFVEKAGIMAFWSRGGKVCLIYQHQISSVCWSYRGWLCYLQISYSQYLICEVYPSLLCPVPEQQSYSQFDEKDSPGHRWIRLNKVYDSCGDQDRYKEERGQGPLIEASEKLNAASGR